MSASHEYFQINFDLFTDYTFKSLNIVAAMASHFM